MTNVIWSSENEMYRIVEIMDNNFDIENLKGDMFNPKYIKEMHDSKMTIKRLKQEEKEFEDLVNREGVFGYALEKWNPAPNTGWEHVNSCFGFVGQYSPNEEIFNHYIVDELKAGAK